MNTMFRTSTFALLALAASLTAQDKVDLSVTSVKKLNLWFQETVKMEQAIDLGAQQMEMGSTTTRVLSVTVDDIDADGKLHLTVKIERIHGQMTVPMMGDVEFDSAKAAGDEDDGAGGFGAGMMTKGLTASAGKSFQAIVGKDGKVVSMTGAKELVDASKQGGGMGGQMGAMSEGKLQRDLQTLFGARPTEPQAAGGKWQHTSVEGEDPLWLEVKSDLTVTKIDGDQVTIEGTATVAKTDKPADQDAKKEADDEDGMGAQRREMFANMKIENAKKSGSFTISRKDGFVVKATDKASMGMKMPSPMGGGEMSVDQKVETTIERTTPDAAKPKAEKKDEAKKEDGKDK